MSSFNLFCMEKNPPFPLRIIYDQQARGCKIRMEHSVFHISIVKLKSILWIPIDFSPRNVKSKHLILVCTKDKQMYLFIRIWSMSVLPARKGVAGSQAHHQAQLKPEWSSMYTLRLILIIYFSSLFNIYSYYYIKIIYLHFFLISLFLTLSS